MASRLNLLLDFSNGQGAGFTNYFDYATDLDTNFTSIQSSVNALVDEVAAARLNNSQLPTDVIITQDSLANSSQGRFSPWEARITFTGANVTTTSGRIYIGGTRIVVVGATLAHVGTAAQTNYLRVDSVSGALSISTTSVPPSGFFNIAVLAASGGNFIMAGSTDLLVGPESGQPLNSGYTINRLHNRIQMDGTTWGHQNPAIRNVDQNGNEEDAGFDYFDVNEFGWYAQRASGSGSGGSVRCATFNRNGQFLLQEQTRVQAMRTTNLNIATGAGYTAVTFDAPVANASGQRTWRREPETYITGPWINASGATLTFPSVNVLTAGTMLWTATCVCDTSAGSAGAFVEARIRATNGTAADIAQIRVAPETTQTILSLSGMMDLAPSDTVQLQLRHGGAGNMVLSSARCCGFLIGAGV